MITSKGHILIVDDVLANLRLLRAMLDEQGFETRGVPNGTTALRAARAHPPDLILLDINLPDLSGYEVCQTLKADPVTQGIPIIFISAIDEVVDKVKAFAVGGADYISKPIQIEEVLARVENQLTVRLLQQQLKRTNETLEQQIATRTAQLAEAKQHAEEMSRLKSAFLANISHELRTPLASIIGFASVLSEESEGDQQEFARLIEQSGQRLLTTLNSILDLSMLEAGTVEADIEVVDVVPEVEQQIAIWGAVAADKRLHLTADVPEQPVQVFVDKALLKRILDNLIGNAIKFTEQGTVHIIVEPFGEQVAIRVSDTGIGISSDFMPGLFDPFKQESTGTGRLYEGTGLGLTVTQKLVDLLGGTIAVESEKENGTTFTVTLPAPHVANKTNTTVSARQVEAKSLPLSTPRLLAVDDNPAMLVLIKRYLKAYNVQVDTARDAETTLSLAQRLAYDVMLLDINLGTARDGIEVLQELRALPGYQHTPVLAVTAYAMPSDRERFLGAGFDAYLSKPFTEQQLHQTLNQVLQASAV